MALRVFWRQSARDDLLALYDWIADHAGSEIAFNYTAQIEAHATALADFPLRGTARDDLVPGLRTIVYRRRTIIAYRLTDHGLEVLRLPHGGRDLGGLFSAGED